MDIFYRSFDHHRRRSEYSRLAKETPGNPAFYIGKVDPDYVHQPYRYKLTARYRYLTNGLLILRLS